MGQEGCHGTEAKVFVEYKREAVAMLESPGVSVSQIAEELGIGANVLGRWRRELRQEPEQLFPVNGGGGHPQPDLFCPTIRVPLRTPRSEERQKRVYPLTGS
jgi:transposase-like protein